MNNQFATQFLREEVDPNWLENYMKQLGADEELIQYTLLLIQKGLIKPDRAIEIMKQTLGLNEDGGTAAPAGGSTTGGGVTNGASFTPGTGEQYAAGTRKKKYQEDAPRLAGEPSKTNKQGVKNLNAYSSVGFTKAPNAEEAGKKLKSIDVEELWEYGQEFFIQVSIRDAKRALELIRDDNYLSKAIIIDASDVYSTNDQEAAEALVYTLKQQGINSKNNVEDYINESRAYSKFKQEAAIRPKSDQLHQAAKMIHNRLAEITKLLEFTSQMRTELSEGEENLEYKHHTKKVFEKINKQVIEVYSKVKGLK